MKKKTAQSGKRITVVLVWAHAPVCGTIGVINGKLQRLAVPSSRGKVHSDTFSFDEGAPRLVVTVSDAQVAAGSRQTRVEVRTGKTSFTFFLRDVTAAAPIFIPEYGVAVTTERDPRDYPSVVTGIRAKGARSELQRIETAPEETYEAASSVTRNLMCPTWLGLGRDMRFFEFGYRRELGYWGYVQPRYHSYLQRVPETDDKPYAIDFAIGPGSSCEISITRWLEDGVLPILKSKEVEGDVEYALTAFTSFETRPLTNRNLRGSPWQAAYPNTNGCQYSREELDAFYKSELARKEMREREDETVCCVRIFAVNNGRVPRYAWFKAASIRGLSKPATYDKQTGSAVFASGRVFGVHRLNGRPMPDPEVAVLLQPGKSAVFEMLIPHQPISAARAKQLAKLDFDQHLKASRKFWHDKLAAGAEIQIPEQAIDERIRAGLLHLDINTLGQEPRGSLMACVGAYSPIGSESAPMILFFDSMGWHEVAERCIQFFLDRQREDGFIQNFGGYQLETGPVLYCIGEHFRYTQDKDWLGHVKAKALKACDYLLAWRNRNKRKELRGRGYGLLDGKVADPDDFFHSFMLNALSYLSIARVAEALAAIDAKQSRRLANEASALKRDIRKAYAEAVARSPVIPAGDGTWVPAAPPWTEYPGPVSLYADGGEWFTHGAFGARDSLIGALWLVFSEVLAPDELQTDFLLRMHHELFTHRNAGLSQPYYCRHDFIHVRRGEVKPFLKTYYNQMTALQDRETYTFWEHYFYASQHKTHEEAWFLMQTRWMLWLEEGRTLSLLKAIPRRWLKDGKRIALKNVRTYFGPVSVTVESHVGSGFVTAAIECTGKRRPDAVTIRLPHPDGKKAVSVTGGTYDADTETVSVKGFAGKAAVTLRF